MRTLLTLWLGISLTACNAPDARLVGVWADSATPARWTFTADGRFTLDAAPAPHDGSWSTEGAVLILVYDGGPHDDLAYQVRGSDLALHVRVRTSDGDDLAGEWIEQAAGRNVDHWKLDAGGAAQVWNDGDYTASRFAGQWSTPAADRVSVTWTGFAIDQSEPAATFRADAQRLDGHTLARTVLTPAPR